MKFCPECGATLVTQKFCQECGANISKYTGGVANTDNLDSFDFSTLQSQAENQLVEQSGLEIENGVLTKYTGKKRSVIIPRFVEEIFNKAFENNNIVASVVIENGVSVIGESAFANCPYLKSIKLPSSIKSIYNYAFYNTRLEELRLDKYNDTILNNIVKKCVSGVIVEYINRGADISSFIRQENGETVIDIKALENKAIDVKNQEIKKAEELRRQELERLAEERRKAEEKKKIEEARLAEEARRRAEEELRKRIQAEEERKRQQREEAKKAVINSWQIGGKPSFGKYHYSDVYWQVLARTGNRALIISLNAVEKKFFHNTQYENYVWESCDLRKWLNNEFLSQFSNEEKGKILPFNGDKVFLLSTDEARRYFKSDNERIISERYGSRRVAWWLRSQGTASYGSYGSGCGVAIVCEDGSVFDMGVCPCNTYDFGRRMTIDNNLGVRPAMWVDVDKIIAEL